MQLDRSSRVGMGQVNEIMAGRIWSGPSEFTGGQFIPHPAAKTEFFPRQSKLNVDDAIEDEVEGRIDRLQEIGYHDRHTDCFAVSGREKAQMYNFGWNDQQ